MTTGITCPECGTHGEIVDGRRDAADFCAACDFPLFWTPTALEVRASTHDGGDARRRLPGAVGKGLLHTVPCPSCGELNLPAATECARCASSMTPPPPPAPVVVPPPLPAPPPVVVVEPEPEPRRWWWLVLAAGLVLTTVVVVVARLS